MVGSSTQRNAGALRSGWGGLCAVVRVWRQSSWPRVFRISPPAKAGRVTLTGTRTQLGTKDLSTTPARARLFGEAPSMRDKTEPSEKGHLAPLVWRFWIDNPGRTCASRLCSSATNGAAMCCCTCLSSCFFALSSSDTSVKPLPHSPTLRFHSVIDKRHAFHFVGTGRESAIAHAAQPSQSRGEGFGRLLPGWPRSRSGDMVREGQHGEKPRRLN